MSNPIIDFTKNKYVLLRVAYDRAVAEDKRQFQFEGHTFDREFARYLLQHLKSKFES